MKKVYLTLFAVLSIIALFNVCPVKTAAFEGQLPKGSVFYTYDENEQFIFRVVKPRTKNKCGEVEIIGLNPSPKEEYSKYSQENLSVYGFEGEAYDIVGIADYAFKDNKTIRSFYAAGTNLRYIGKGAFEGCTNLREFSNNREDLTTIKSRAFAGCKSMCRFGLEGNKLKKVGADAFKDTFSLIKIDAGSSVKHAKKIQKLFKKAGANRVVFKKTSLKK